MNMYCCCSIKLLVVVYSLCVLMCFVVDIQIYQCIYCICWIYKEAASTYPVHKNIQHSRQINFRSAAGVCVCVVLPRFSGFVYPILCACYFFSWCLWILIQSCCGSCRTSILWLINSIYVCAMLAQYIRAQPVWSFLYLYNV